MVLPSIRRETNTVLFFLLLLSLCRFLLIYFYWTLDLLVKIEFHFCCCLPRSERKGPPKISSSSSLSSLCIYWRYLIVFVTSTILRIDTALLLRLLTFLAAVAFFLLVKLSWPIHLNPLSLSLLGGREIDNAATRCLTPVTSLRPRACSRPSATISNTAQTKETSGKMISIDFHTSSSPRVRLLVSESKKKEKAFL